MQADHRFIVVLDNVLTGIKKYNKWLRSVQIDYGCLIVVNNNKQTKVNGLTIPQLYYNLKLTSSSSNQHDYTCICQYKED